MVWQSPRIGFCSRDGNPYFPPLSMIYISPFLRFASFLSLFPFFSPPYGVIFIIFVFCSRCTSYVLLFSTCTFFIQPSWEYCVACRLYHESLHN